MGREHLKFGGGVSETVLHPAVLVIILIAGVLVCFGSRRNALAVFLVTSILIPMDQVLLVGSLHFPMLRLLALFGFVRLIKDKLSRKSRIFSGGVNRIDIAVILFTLIVAVNGVLLFPEVGAFVNQLGQLYTVFGVYFLLRLLIRDEADILQAIRTLVYITAAVALVMGYEFATGHNPYAVLGGLGLRSTRHS